MRDRLLPLPDPAFYLGEGGTGSPTRTEEARRAAYQWGLPIALLAVAVGLALVWPLHPAQTALWGGLAGVLAVALVLSALPRCPVGVLDRLLLLGGWTFLLGRLALGLFAPHLVDGGPELLGLLLPWFVLGLLAPGWLLDSSLGRWVARGALAVTGALGALYGVRVLLGTGESGLILALLAQLLLVGGLALLGQEATLTRTEDRRGPWSGLLPGECDELTGLPLRRPMERRLRTLRRPVAVAVVGVDDLPDLERGGGAVLVQTVRAHLARTLAAATRTGDPVACLGEGTFAVLLPTTDPLAVRVVAERLRLRVASRPLAGRVVTVSVGLAVGTGAEALARAEAALRDAQAGGGHRVEVAPE
ncbi:GGDEF domain-containing protein [Deinococcus sp. HSC-46F16]|uniref:GGDEF domain-containing protein n=1 Tax=Deinococcus sp. HSC-46F16 TaxID=2910968 RepID=UPI0020A062D2|nr:diguanylate cyclase [Deinococcus sp. HSC-46F16]MCP2014918.1 GGDEF domain-containing protein [Deinococcus sp. HSC-46F16]